jgi:NADH-quinone oxidoreductase subunit B
VSSLVPLAPSGGPGAGFEPRPAALVLEAGRRYALTLVNVGLACCAVEAMVASLGSQAVPGAVPYADGARDIDVLVVSGTVTDKLAPLVRRLYDDLPGPVRVLSFGACANSGGPYWDSYCVTRGVDLVVPVDAYVPGCPPRPQALLDALAALDAPARPVRRDAVALRTPVLPAPDGPPS